MISKYQQQVLKRAASLYTDRLTETPEKMLGVATDVIKAGQLYGLGVMAYFADFMIPFWTAWQSFNRLEKEKLLEVQKVLDEMKADGTMAKISEKWFGKDITK